MKTFTATHLNKHAQEVFAAAKDGTVMIDHDRYEGRFIIKHESITQQLQRKALEDFKPIGDKDD